MAKIKIDKFVQGSKENIAGDATLYYTNSDISETAKSICLNKKSNDNDKFPSDHSTFLALYSNADDKYIFIHVQADNWVFEAGARNYIYRGAFCISRNDMSKEQSLRDVVLSLPRIKDIEKESNSKSGEIDILQGRESNITVDVENLGDHIKQAMLNGERLFISLKQSEVGPAKGDDLFSNNKFNTLLAAIDLLPQNMKKYATFSFLANKEYDNDIREAVINIYIEGEAEPKSNSEKLSWTDAISPVKTNPNQKNEKLFAMTLKEGKLLSWSKLQDCMAKLPTIEENVNHKRYQNVSENDWTIWFAAGNDYKQLKITCWSDYVSVKCAIGKSIGNSKAGDFSKNFLRDSWKIEKVLPTDLENWEKELDKCGFFEGKIKDLWNFISKNKGASLQNLVEFAKRHPNTDISKFVELPFVKLGVFDELNLDKKNPNDKNYIDLWDRLHKDYCSKNRPQSLGDVIKALESVVEDSKGLSLSSDKLKELNKEDFKSIFNDKNINKEQVEHLFSLISELKNKDLKVPLEESVRSAATNYADKEYKLSEVEKWSDYLCKYPHFIKFALENSENKDKYAKSLLDYLTKCSKHSKHFELPFMASIKPLFKALLDGLDHSNSSYEPLKKYYKKLTNAKIYSWSKVAMGVVVGLILGSVSMVLLHTHQVNKAEGGAGDEGQGAPGTENIAKYEVEVLLRNSTNSVVDTIHDSISIDMSKLNELKVKTINIVEKEYTIGNENGTKDSQGSANTDKQKEEKNGNEKSEKETKK